MFQLEVREFEPRDENRGSVRVCERDIENREEREQDTHCSANLHPCIFRLSPCFPLLSALFTPFLSPKTFFTIFFSQKQTLSRSFL
jgi:hypothetical protein